MEKFSSADEAILSIKKPMAGTASAVSQLSINGVGLTKPLTTSLNPTSKHSSRLREPSRVVGRGEVGITGYQPNIEAWLTSLV